MKNTCAFFLMALTLESMLQLFIIKGSNANPETILYVSPSATRVHVGEILSINISIQDVIDL